jgi:hypothetical protein
MLTERLKYTAICATVSLKGQTKMRCAVLASIAVTGANNPQIYFLVYVIAGK